MNENDIELIRKALELYEFTIKQRQKDKWDEDVTQFYEMKNHVSQFIGFDL